MPRRHLAADHAVRHGIQSRICGSVRSVPGSGPVTNVTPLAAPSGRACKCDSWSGAQVAGGNQRTRAEQTRGCSFGRHGICYLSLSSRVPGREPLARFASPPDVPGKKRPPWSAARSSVASQATASENDRCNHSRDRNPLLDHEPSSCFETGFSRCVRWRPCRARGCPGRQANRLASSSSTSMTQPPVCLGSSCRCPVSAPFRRAWPHYDHPAWRDIRHAAPCSVYCAVPRSSW